MVGINDGRRFAVAGRGATIAAAAEDDERFTAVPPSPESPYYRQQGVVNIRIVLVILNARDGFLFALLFIGAGHRSH